MNPLPLGSRVTVSMPGGAELTGVVIAKSYDDPMRYDFKTAEGEIYQTTQDQILSFILPKQE